VQASPVWTPPQGTLGGIVAEAFERAAALRDREAELRRRADRAPAAPSLVDALRAATVGVIAEVKRRSPSKGWINPGLTAADQARAYARGGAAAVSVLTEPVHFGGSVDDLEAVRRTVAIPVLKKDFHVDPIQLIEAKAIGASAALLIARALSPDALMRMVDAARSLGLEALIEVRDDEELARALDAGATLIGINNRNLESLVIEEGTAERLLAHVPASVVAISESGVQARAEVERVALAGADGVLVGSAISAAPDPTAAVRGLVDVRRVPRAR
jgi:indole-3-glycerol phosphate synthase